MRYLVDTNIISEVMRQQPDPRVVRWFASLDRIALSVVTVEELLFGLGRKRLVHKAAWFRQFCVDRVKCLEINEAMARWSGEKRATLSQQGIAMSMADSLIAAAAHETGLVLATRNVKGFENTGIALFNPFVDVE